MECELYCQVKPECFVFDFFGVATIGKKILRLEIQVCSDDSEYGFKSERNYSFSSIIISVMFINPLYIYMMM